MTGIEDFAVEIAARVGISVEEARWRLAAIVDAYGQSPGALTVRDFYRPDWLPALEADAARRCAVKTLPTVGIRRRLVRDYGEAP